MYRVLVVDDEIYEREGIRRQISWEQYGIGQVDTAENGLAALNKFEEEPYEIVISDIKMPIMDGLTMALRMCDILPEVKILFLSGYDDFVYARQAIQLHAYDYLLKPVGGELEEKVKEMTRLLDKEQLQRNREQTLLAENTEHQMILGTELFDYFINGCWNPIKRILGSLKYLEQPYLLWAYGYLESPGELDQKQCMQELRRMMTHISGSVLIGICDGRTLLIIPAKEAYSGQRKREICRSLEQGMRDACNVEFIFRMECFVVQTDSFEEVQDWRENVVLPLANSTAGSGQNILLVKKMTSIVKSRYMEDLTVKGIAEELLYSPNYLSMIFKREMGQGFYEYMVSVRMQKARELLAEENAKVYMVANAVGYEDTVAFIKRFKKEFGCTPTQFRNTRL